MVLLQFDPKALKARGVKLSGYLKIADHDSYVIEHTVTSIAV